MSSRAFVFSADANSVEVLRAVLAELELEVECSADKELVGQKLASEKYAVIVIDSGEQSVSETLLAKASASSVNRNALRVAVIGAQTHARSAFGLGANFVLYRPVNAERVRASLRAASHLIQREKRRYPRAPVHTQAVISCPAVENATATLLDLSIEGLSLQCEKRLPAKSKIYFRFTLPGQMKWIQLSGETVWQDSTGRVGIRFADVPATARRLLNEWLDSAAGTAASKVTVQLPVQAPGPLSGSPPDRRIQARHTCRLGVDLYESGRDIPNRCSLTDISVGGCYVESTAPFKVGTPVDIVVRTEAFKFMSHGTVQTVNPGFGMGIAFGTQTAKQRQQVQDLIKLVFEDRAAGFDPVLKF
ncbi:MAG TPA: PilZ domain-containing protein [Terriglobales bacterium]|nr:PilZ domain-containing protein [Terriglobales bacterium]